LTAAPFLITPIDPSARPGGVSDGEETRLFADNSDWEFSTLASRLCESCETEPATVHVVKIDGGEIRHSHLCPNCAEEAAEEPQAAAVIFAVPADVAGLVGRLAEKGLEEQRERADDGLACGVCGTTSHDLEETGLVGCPACYDTHAAIIDLLLDKGLGPRLHQGKVPRQVPASLLLRREIRRLERMLQELIEDERFEEAASVRDRLLELGDGTESPVR
jgi:protein arginine kinase activator